MTTGDAALLLLGGLSVLLWAGGRAVRRALDGRWRELRRPATFADERVWRDTSRVTGLRLQRFATWYLPLNLVLVPFPDLPALLASVAVLLVALLALSGASWRYARRRIEHYATIDEALKQSDRGKRM
ncbi:MAG: hypothetical protein GEU80_03745 [Dehalococcoidia bacterium]|nr:hypothetical protein [Dehalococcoidia bacterium]